MSADTPFSPLLAKESAAGGWFDTFTFADGSKIVGLNSAGKASAYYPLREARFVAPARAVLMDLDGTTAKSEEFWISVVEMTAREILRRPHLTFCEGDIPFVSGHTTLDHLSYCIRTYGQGEDVNRALALYHAITEREMKKSLSGERSAAFAPREGLKDFLLELKAKKVKIGLATSGLDYKAIPEIVSVFREIGLGDPLEFYDAVVTGGRRKDTGDWGTIGELAAKPHPWIYSELGAVGLKCPPEEFSHAVGIEDSAAGVMSLRLAGYPVIAFRDGNAAQSGVQNFCHAMADDFEGILKLLF